MNDLLGDKIKLQQVAGSPPDLVMNLDNSYVILRLLFHPKGLGTLDQGFSVHRGNGETLTLGINTSSRSDGE